MELDIGTIIVATGYDQFNPSLKPEYGYDLYENVITGLEFERLSTASGPTGGKIEIEGKEPKDVVFISCVGSRDKQVGNEYCSRVCCMYIAKQAQLVKEHIPDANITVFYTDVRAFGKGYEAFYARVQREGVKYIRGNAAEVYKKKKGGKIIVKGEDTLLGKVVEIEADLVILATGMVPSKDADKIVNLLKLPKDPDNFLLEAHPKLRPVDTVIDGVFLAGCCQSPKDIPDTVSQAKAAALCAVAKMAKGKVENEPIVAVVDESLCRGCGRCIQTCEFDAIEAKEIREGFLFVAHSNEARCKGCGACSVVCPSSAITMNHFTDNQILAMVRAPFVEV
jgi:heterodisulfide reductase subunit A